MISNEQIIVRLAAAALLGGLIGLERERLDRAAGLRTHALVSVGATLFMLVSAFGFADVHGVSSVVLDPSRVAAQVVSGIGFLGAGTIIVQRGSIRGLTTAASVWAVAAIGLSVGGGLYIAAVSATTIMLIILAGVKPIEQKMSVNRHRSLTMTIDQQAASLASIRAAVERSGIRLQKIVVLPGAHPNEDRIELSIRGANGASYLSVVDRLRQLPGVRQLESSLGATEARSEHDEAA